MHVRDRWLLAGVVGLFGLVAASAMSAVVDRQSVQQQGLPRAEPTRATALEPVDIARRSLAATVQIRNLDAFGARRSDGTGFHVGAGGLVATSLHVVHGAFSLEVSSLFGKAYDSVHFVAASPRHDLAVLRVFGIDEAKPMQLRSVGRPAIGERVYVTGNPHGQTGTFSDGLVSAHRASSGVTLLQISAPVSPGSSGGPVIDASGRVIGVTTLRLRRGLNLNYAVPASYLQRLLDSLPASVRYRRALMPTPSELSGPVADFDGHQPGFREDSARLDVIARQVRSADSAAKAAKAAPDRELITGAIPHEDSARHGISVVSGGEYVIAGFCDSNCVGLDLELNTSSGRLVDLDVGVDDTPKLRFTATATETYQLSVRTPHCDARQCRYGVRVYRIPRGKR